MTEPVTSAPLGLSIASHSGLPAPAIGEIARAAEAAGFGAVFVAEGHGDALALCHPVIAATRNVRVGTAIANAALRPPVLAAKTAVQLDQASEGRFLLGLGVANDVMNGRFGLTPFPPLRMVAEYVAVVRAVLAGDQAVSLASCSAPGWCHSTARRSAMACRSTWPRSGRACSSWPGGSPMASS
jgi:5,10-methylenetetrahydromethanopterin reductase